MRARRTPHRVGAHVDATIDPRSFLGKFYLAAAPLNRLSEVRANVGRLQLSEAPPRFERREGSIITAQVISNLFRADAKLARKAIRCDQISH
jgi:hypothetical protein